jgi:hypothetical protein
MLSASGASWPRGTPSPAACVPQGYGNRAVAFAGHRVGLETGRLPLYRNGATTWLPWSTVSGGRSRTCASP